MRPQSRSIWISGLGLSKRRGLGLRFLLGLPLARVYAALVGRRRIRRPHLPGQVFCDYSV